jgi:hypothetical protein
MQFDLRGQNLEALMDFIFDHPVPTITSETGWWWESEVDIDPEEYAANLTAIFRAPAVLRSRYTREQLEQGFWMLISGAEPSLDPILWNPGVPWSVRTALIQATVDLYEKLFAFDSLDTSAHMFWDGLVYGYCVPTRHPETDMEDRRVQEAIFSALSQILEIDCPLVPTRRSPRSWPPTPSEHGEDNQDVSCSEPEASRRPSPIRHRLHCWRYPIACLPGRLTRFAADGGQCDHEPPRLKPSRWADRIDGIE